MADSGTRALVTGANGGIGRAIVERLRDDGFDVTTMDVTAPADLVCDLATGEVPREQMGEFDVCVSNAGIVDILAPAHRMSAEKWDHDIAVNLTGSFRVIQACLPGMRERRYGRIVVMSSMAAKLGAQGQVAYGASKAGLLGMAKTIAAENADRGITVNSVLPGLIGTVKVRAMPEHIFDRVRTRSNFLATGRIGEPAEVAGLVAYLVSPEAAYVTGQEIAIDGAGGLSPFSLSAKA